MAQELLRLQDLAKYYTSAQSVVVGLNQINLTFCRGEFVAVTGESGSGKSTMAHVLGGILPYEGGELLYKGKPTSHYDSADWERYRRDCVSFISQSYGILPGSSVMDNVTCALRLVGFSKEQADRDAEEILKRVELWDLRRRRAAKLSSGQKQRLSIARALAKPAPVLIADEPTGNLDAENSAMVIKLLAEAAKDRLVILITHEFSEAEDYVTRHIELHDGRVTMDARLREAPELPATRPEEKRGEAREKKRLSWFVSRFQVKARPVWAVLMLCFFAFTVFAMFAAAGTFISNLDDTFTYRYDPSAFPNGEPRRIVAVRPGGGEFTQEDLDKILSVRYVESVEECGYVTDIQYAYREGVDYEIQNSLVSEGLFEYTSVSSYTLKRTRDKMPFVRTIPALPEGQEFLTAGRLPENIYEVVAAGGEELLEQKITVLIQDQKNWNADTFISMDVTVVGVTDYGAHLYFHEDLGKVMIMNTRSDARALYLPLPEKSVVIGKELTVQRNNNRGDYAFYKTIGYGLVGREDDLLDIARQQAVEYILASMADMEELVDAFSLERGTKERFVLFRLLNQYAAAWELGDELFTVMNEVGLSDEVLFADEDNGWTNWGMMVRDILMDEELSNRVDGVAEPLLQKFKDFYEKKKEAFFAIDIDGLDTMEKVTDMLNDWWGPGDPWIYDHYLSVSSVSAGPHWLWGRTPEVDEYHVIQPGEVLVSSTTESSLISSLKYKDVRTDAELERAREEAEFLQYKNLLNMSEMDNANGKGTYRDFTVVGTKDVGYHWVTFLHPDDFRAMIYPGKGGQLSVFIEDYAYVDRVLDAIHGLGYGAISPYREGAVEQKEELAAQRTQTLRVCLIALLAVIILQILLLRAMFSMETESYRLLSHIGLDCVTAQRSVFWQIMLFALGGQMLGVGLITACTLGGMDQLVHILRYLPLSYRIALCAVHLCASALTAVWSMKALKKQVFPESGAQPDLDWDAIDEEVEA